MRLRAPILALLAAVSIAACSDSTIEPVTVVGSARRLAVGASVVCALDGAGQTSCWGVNSFMAYGMATPLQLSSSIPVATPHPSLVTLSGATYHMCGLTAARQAICWGRGSTGQLGRGVVEPSTSNTPAPVVFDGQWAGIRAGRLTTCGWTSTGTGYCWGLNQHGEIGDTAVARGTRVATPTQVNGGISFAVIEPGWQHTCGISTAGTLYCWGYNRSGQLGIGAADTVDHGPTMVASSEKFAKVAAGPVSTCAITTSNKLYCWGSNGTGQLGDGTTTRRDAPTPVSSTLKFIDVAMSNGTIDVGASVVVPTAPEQLGIGHTCALTEAKTVYCWGWNGAGQLGNNSTTTSMTPLQVFGAADYTGVFVGGTHTCATTATELRCWGANNWGQLGNGTTVDSSIPLKANFQWP